jgi:hypothetical protein
MAESALKSKSSVALFKDYPGQFYIDDFIGHLRATGQPDTWRFHCVDPPLVNEDNFVELCSFSVPTHLRAKVGMATCPICSALSPQYYDGKLVWFPLENVVRAIGIDCAKKLFGSEVVEDAARANKAKSLKYGAQDYLLDAYPRVRAITDKVVRSLPTARIVDLLQQKLWALTSKSACNGLYKHAKTGSLKIFDQVQSPSSDRFGNIKFVTTQVEVMSYPVVGVGFLGRSISVASHASNTIEALNRIEVQSNGAQLMSQDQALEFITTTLENESYLWEAERLVKQALEAAKSLDGYLEDAHRFFSASNLKNLHDWSNHRLVAAPIQVWFDQNFPLEVKVGKPGRRIEALPLGQLLKGK